MSSSVLLLPVPWSPALPCCSPTSNRQPGRWPGGEAHAAFQELNRDGPTIVVATHNDTLVARHAAPALRLDRGRIVDAR